MGVKLGKVFRKGDTMNEIPNTRIAERFEAMVGAYETWAEPLSARLSQVALGRSTVSAGDCVLDIGAAALGARDQGRFLLRSANPSRRVAAPTAGACVNVRNVFDGSAFSGRPLRLINFAS